MPADARDAARRIVEEVFDGSDPVVVVDAPTARGSTAPTAPTATGSERERSPARSRARDLVAEVFGPAVPRGAEASGSSSAGPRRSSSEAASRPAPARASEPEVPRSKAPSAAEVAGRRIVAEAEAAQRARAAAEAEAAQQARAAAQAAERAVAERAAAEAEAAAQRERAVRARQRRREQAAAAAAPGSTTEASPAGPAAPVESRPVAAEPLPPPAPVADPHPPRAPAVAPPPPPDEEVLFVPSGTEAPSPDEGEVLFDGSQRAEGTGLPPSTAADVDGPPPPPRQHPADPIGQLPVLEPAEELPEARRTSAEPPVALEPGDDLPAPQLAARLVSEVLHERDDGTPPTAEDAPEPSPVRTETQALRAGRWVLVTVVAAVALALLFPLAVRAVLELVSLS